MAEFSITFCANWRHNGSMTRTRLALLLFPAVPLAPVLLALAACGDGHSGSREQQNAPSAPLGFELAMAGTAGADAAAAVPDAAPRQLVAISADELAARLRDGNIRLIDVRTDAEVAEGAIPGAEHIPLDQFDPEKLDLSDGREIVLYCRSGRRSAVAGEKLASVTGKPVEHLAGGVLEWAEAGQPFAPK
jgi:rhodanese-related sulfurtransferase